jgi:hypothetical protein
MQTIYHTAPTTSHASDWSGSSGVTSGSDDERTISKLATNLTPSRKLWYYGSMDGSLTPPYG